MKVMLAKIVQIRCWRW